MRRYGGLLMQPANAAKMDDVGKAGNGEGRETKIGRLTGASI